MQERDGKLTIHAIVKPLTHKEKKWFKSAHPAGLYSITSGGQEEISLSTHTSKSTILHNQVH